MPTPDSPAHSSTCKTENRKRQPSADLSPSPKLLLRLLLLSLLAPLLVFSFAVARLTGPEGDDCYHVYDLFEPPSGPGLSSSPPPETETSQDSPSASAAALDPTMAPAPTRRTCPVCHQEIKDEPSTVTKQPSSSSHSSQSSNSADAGPAPPSADTSPLAGPDEFQTTTTTTTPEEAAQANNNSPTTTTTTAMGAAITTTTTAARPTDQPENNNNKSASAASSDDEPTSARRTLTPPSSSSGSPDDELYQIHEELLAIPADPVSRRLLRDGRHILRTKVRAPRSPAYANSLHGGRGRGRSRAVSAVRGRSVGYPCEMIE